MGDSSKRTANWTIGNAALAACCFIVAVIASVMITVVLHPHAPLSRSADTSVDTAGVVSTLGFIFSIYALLCSVWEAVVGYVHVV